MKFLLALLLTLSPLTAQADCDGVWQPPAQYASMPAIMPTLTVVNIWDVDGLCRAMGVEAQGRMDSCTSKEFGTIVLPRSGEDGITTMYQECLLLHELGHANGWGPEHLGAV